jgi:LacI family transcriptional regulator
MEVIHGIEGVMNQNGYEVLIYNTDENPRKEIRALSMLKQLHIGGIIAVPVSDVEKYNTDYLIEMNSNGVPVVLLDRDLQYGNIDGVFMDNFNSAYQSIQKFIDNRHTHIAIISGPTTSTSGIARLNGYLAALRANQIPVREEYILYGDFKFDLAYELTKKLISKEKEVTAIFASNSRMSMGCLMALAENRISIPKDMAFISCGKLGIDYGCLSSVEYPTGSIGAECAKILLEKMKTEKKSRNGPKKRITFDMELVLRGSEVYPANRIKSIKKIKRNGA